MKSSNRLYFKCLPKFGWIPCGWPDHKRMTGGVALCPSDVAGMLGYVAIKGRVIALQVSKNPASKKRGVWVTLGRRFTQNNRPWILLDEDGEELKAVMPGQFEMYGIEPVEGDRYFISAELVANGYNS